MRFYYLFRDAPFDAEHIELRASAFEDVSGQLGLERARTRSATLSRGPFWNARSAAFAIPLRSASAPEMSYRPHDP
jgi:hypothetical protein